LKTYPTIKSQLIFFNATILNYIVPTIANRNYYVNEDPLYIQYEPFQVIPSNYDVGPTSIQLFEYTEKDLPTQIDLSCTCLTDV
jgi:hypothetical protein